MVVRVFWVVARTLLGCSEWLLGQIWVVVRVFWVVAKMFISFLKFFSFLFDFLFYAIFVSSYFVKLNNLLLHIISIKKVK